MFSYPGISIRDERRAGTLELVPKSYANYHRYMKKCCKLLA